MGRPKLSLPLAGRTVLDHVILALKAAEVAEILVVVAPDADDLAGIARACGAHVLRLSKDTPDMQTTVTEGLQWLEQRFEPRPDDYWLLVPGDHPTLKPEVVRELLQARSQHSSATVFVPTYEGHRGHPTLIAWSHVAAILSWPSSEGLNRFLRQYVAETCECSVEFPEVLWDLDRPEDYDLLLQRQEGNK